MSIIGGVLQSFGAILIFIGIAVLGFNSRADFISSLFVTGGALLMLGSLMIGG